MTPIKQTVLGLPLLLAACADPMTAPDGIMPVAGLAQIHNAGVHVVNPNAGYGSSNPGGSGRRAAVIIDRYNSAESLEDAEPATDAGININDF